MSFFTWMFFWFFLFTLVMYIVSQRKNKKLRKQLIDVRAAKITYQRKFQDLSQYKIEAADWAKKYYQLLEKTLSK